MEVGFERGRKYKAVRHQAERLISEALDVRSDMHPTHNRITLGNNGLPPAP